MNICINPLQLKAVLRSCIAQHLNTDVC